MNKTHSVLSWLFIVVMLFIMMTHNLMLLVVLVALLEVRVDPFDRSNAVPTLFNQAVGLYTFAIGVVATHYWRMT